MKYFLDLFSSIEAAKGIQKSRFLTFSFISLLIETLDGLVNIDLLPKDLAPNSAFPQNLPTILFLARSFAA